MGVSEGSPEVQDTRRSVNDPHLASAAEKEVVEERAQWRGPRMKN